jgi:alpha-mannosidase
VIAASAKQVRQKVFKEIRVPRARLGLHTIGIALVLTIFASRLPAQKDEIDLVGHAHIDASWLWPRSETIHEVLPLTFESALRLMQQHPDFIYAQSSAQYYVWMERYYPELFAQIAEKVRSGQWEIVGGQWVEHNTNIPCGESLVRQHLYAKRYFKEKFGVDVRVGWLPDVFGFNWNMPQIYRKSGIDYFVTHKLKWQVELNDPPVPFPHHLFWWQAPDGSRVLAFHTVGDYNQQVMPEQMLKYLEDLKSSGGGNKLLILYGQGDHGGGPMPEMVDRATKLMHDPNYPAVHFSKALDYFKSIEGRPDSAQLPVVNDELYVKTHRGTFTTDAQVKRDNRQSEVLLMNAEKFALVARQFGQPYPQEPLKGLWEKLIFGQVHDNIDGSAVAEVYRDAATDYADIKAAGRKLLDASLAKIAGRVNTAGEGRALLVFNSLPWERTDVVLLDSNVLTGLKSFTIMDPQGASVPYQIVNEGGVEKIIVIAENVPGLGYKQYRATPNASRPESASDLVVSGLKLANSLIELEIDGATGNLKSLREKGMAANFLREGAEANALEVWEDRPPNAPAGEPAWNIYLGDVNRVDKADSVEVIEKGPVRAVVRVKKSFGKSSFEQDIILYHHSDRVDFEIRADWHEKYRFAKVAFPLNLATTYATYEIPFGSIQRFDSTLKEDPRTMLAGPPRAWEIADRTKTEVAAQRWVDVSNQAGDYGVSLLNDSKYGFSFEKNALRLSLLRGARRGYPETPESWSDQSSEPLVGIHHVKYALVPHRGSWQDANATRRGAQFNAPLLVKSEPSHAGSLAGTFGVLNIEPANVTVESLKKAEDSDEFIVRLYETDGKSAKAVLTFNRTPLSARETDMLEWDKYVVPAAFAVEGMRVKVSVKPHEIKTIRVRFP